MKMASTLLQLVLCCLIVSSSLLSFSHADGYLPIVKIRGPNLGGWLVTEGWIKPSLFEGIVNIDFTDGANLHFKCMKTGKYLAAMREVATRVVAISSSAGAAETFRVWRVNETFFQLRSFNDKFVGSEAYGVTLVTQAKYPLESETFELVRKPGDNYRIKIKASNGFYVQVKSDILVTADYKGEGWEDDNPSVFNYTVTSTMQGEYQVTNGYSPEKASKVMNEHWNTFITEEDFKFIADNGMNGVRIPVGWWTTLDPNPPKPFVAGSLGVLDNAFSWAEKYKLKVILDLHCAPGSQSSWAHSGTRDGSLLWGKTEDTILETVRAIEFFAARYGKSSSFYAMELLNEPLAPWVHLDTLMRYYTLGYHAVRKYTQSAYVMMSVRIDDPTLGGVYAKDSELFPLASGLPRSVIDVHYYSTFLSYFRNMTAEENIQYIKTNRTAELTELALDGKGKVHVFVGEWCAEWLVPSSTKKERREFIAAQAEVYSRATDFGWNFFTLKAERAEENFYSVKWLVENGYMKF